MRHMERCECGKELYTTWAALCPSRRARDRKPRGLDATTAEVASLMVMVKPFTVGEALTPTEVIEFCNGVDWFQLSQVVGHRNPLHRWRVVGYRGDVEGEWTW